MPAMILPVATCGTAAKESDGPKKHLTQLLRYNDKDHSDEIFKL